GVGGQPLFQVGVHGVHAVVLQPVGAYFGGQTGAASFVTAQVDQHATAFGRDGCSCGGQLRPAVTAQRPERFTGEAFRMDSHEHILRLGRYVAEHKCEVFGTIGVGEHDGSEIRVRGGQVGTSHFPERVTCRTVVD